MAGLAFLVSELLDELDAARALAGPFLENSDSVFQELRTQLEGLRYEYTAGLAWQTSPTRPIRTITSNGEYLRTNKGYVVVGTLSFVWDLKRIHPKKPKTPARECELSGRASAVARVIRLDSKKEVAGEVAMWRTEVGDDNSPGCHFHVQIMGETNNLPFPKDLSVPRLPTCLPSPMVALEFLLAELFQERWKQHVVSETDPLKRWRAIQRYRLSKLFKWQTEVVLADSRPPWSALKIAKPPRDLFVS